MQNYKQILEAVNRGIQLALDDFDNEEQVLHVKSRLINHRDYTKEYLDLLRDEAVDLGLPSGTLWCKYNLGVEPNKLKTAKQWYGKYYAWGETKPNKSEFSIDNYKFGNDYKKLTKYCNTSKYGLNKFTDNLTKLLPEDDAAYQFKKCHNFKFHIPTKELCDELINCTKNYWVNNYDPNKTVHNSEDDGGIKGLNGRVFEGQNGNLLFIPAAGGRCGSDIYEDGEFGDLWSSSLSLDEPYCAYGLGFHSTNICIYFSIRSNGCSVRPVLY